MTIVWILLLFFEYLKHIKECIFNDEISDKDKVFIIKRQLKSIE